MAERDVDFYRKGHLSVAEMIDAWRIIPRVIVLLFGYGVVTVVKWYLTLKPYILESCIEHGGTISECLIAAPTNQHLALLTALFALAAAIFGFYAQSSRKWNGFTPWNKPKP